MCTTATSSGALLSEKLVEIARYAFSYHIPHFPRLRSASSSANPVCDA